MTLLYKALPGAAPLDVAEGTARILANTTGVVDAQNDLMMPGCWQGVLGAKPPKICLGHDHDQVVGKVTRLQEWMPDDPRLPAWHQANKAGALVADITFAMHKQSGVDAFNDVKGSWLDEWSVGMVVAPGGAKYGASGRMVTDVAELFEVSAVLVGASPQTATLSAKSRGAYRGRPVWIRAVEPAVRRMVAGEVARDRARRDVFAAIEGETASPWRRATAGR